jgi:hypothetical protein
LRNQIRAHFARTDDTDAHRAAHIGTLGEIAGKAGQGDIGHAGCPQLLDLRPD